MSNSPLEQMIDRACTCVKCGAAGPVGTCGCWVLLECPKCDKRRWCEPEPDDDPAVARIVYPCGDHDDDGTEPVFYDKGGAVIPPPDVTF